MNTKIFREARCRVVSGPIAIARHIVSKGPHFGHEPKFPNFHLFLPIWVWRAKKFFAKPRNSFSKKVRLVAFCRNKSNNEIGTTCQPVQSLLSLCTSRKTTQHGRFSMFRICPGQIRYLSGKWRLITVRIDSYVSTSATAPSRRAAANREKMKPIAYFVFILQ